MYADSDAEVDGLAGSLWVPSAGARSEFDEVLQFGDADGDLGLGGVVIRLAAHVLGLFAEVEHGGESADCAEGVVGFPYEHAARFTHAVRRSFERHHVSAVNTWTRMPRSRG